jgi:hypothetical protein
MYVVFFHTRVHVPGPRGRGDDNFVFSVLLWFHLIDLVE